MEVRPVGSRRELREFIELPFRLHSSSPQWIPPLRLERHAFLSRRFNVLAGHGVWRLFLARRGGRVVGRVSAQVDHAFNAYHGNRWGMFGFLEREDDPEVMAALRDAAAGWLRGRGCDRMVGPMDFTVNDELGVLIEGFDLEPMVRQPWHPPYYQRLCAGAGLQKEVDLFMWHLHISDREHMLPIMFELAEAAERDHGVRVRKMTRRTLRRDLDVFAEIYNDAWKRNWGFVPYTKEDLDVYVQEMQLAFDHDWFMVAEIDGEPVGAAITIPDVNQALQRMNGRLLPLGWWHFLRRRRYIDRVRVGFLGVKRDFQHTGVAARLFVEHFDMAGSVGPEEGEMGWILETNNPMNRAMEAMHGRIVKKYRVYQVSL